MLPGFHGTAQLWDSFVDHAPSWAETIPLDLPSSTDQSYPILVSQILKSIDHASPSILIAESFSGPLAILLASELGDRVRLLVLGNTFAVSPLGWIGKLLPLWLISRFPVNSLGAKFWLTGGNTSLARQVSSVVSKLPRALYEARLRTLIDVDVTQAFATLNCPILIIRGTNDRVVGSRYARQWAELNSRASLSTIRSAHMVFQLSPEEAWKAIEQRIDQGK